MKTIIITCLLLVLLPPAFGSTNCKIKEYSDHIELICVGDEKTMPESIISAMPARSKTTENLAKRRQRATRNTNNLKNFTSATIPPGQ